MNSRERVLNTLKHKEPDMVPFDLGGTDSSGITGIAYNRLRKYLGFAQGETQIIDAYGQIVRIEDDVRDLLKPDTIMLMKVGNRLNYQTVLYLVFLKSGIRKKKIVVTMLLKIAGGLSLPACRPEDIILM